MGGWFDGVWSPPGALTLIGLSWRRLLTVGDRH